MVCQLSFASQHVFAATAEEEASQSEQLQEYDEKGGMVEEGGYEQGGVEQDQYELQEPQEPMEEEAGPEAGGERPAE